MEPLIKPFAGTCYNIEKVKKMDSVACPPYDVINDKQLSALRKKSPYNFSHVLLPNADYAYAAKLLNQWLEKQILIEDDKESIYLYEQKFIVEGKPVKRFGLLTLLSMDRQGVIHPHEHTLSKPKEDRKRLIAAVKANLSPIFVMVPQKVDALHAIYKLYARKKACMQFSDVDGVEHKVWRISDLKQCKQLQKAFEQQRLVIADGHHRFEVSHDFYKKHKGKYKDLNYTLAYVTDAQRGLRILPTHRVVTVKENKAQLLARLKEKFSVEKVSAQTLDRYLRRKGMFCFGIYCQGSYYFCKLKQRQALAFSCADPLHQKLDSYLLQELVFSLLSVAGDIQYSHSIKEAKAIAGKDKVAFLLRPISLDVVCSMAQKGYRFPQKSTYFYPKLSSGIVIRRFGP